MFLFILRQHGPNRLKSDSNKKRYLVCLITCTIVRTPCQWWMQRVSYGPCFIYIYWPKKHYSVWPKDWSNVWNEDLSRPKFASTVALRSEARSGLSRIAVDHWSALSVSCVILVIGAFARAKLNFFSLPQYMQLTDSSFSLCAYWGWDGPYRRNSSVEICRPNRVQISNYAFITNAFGEVNMYIPVIYAYTVTFAYTYFTLEWLLCLRANISSYNLETGTSTCIVKGVTRDFNKEVGL